MPDIKDMLVGKKESVLATDLAAPFVNIVAQAFMSSLEEIAASVRILDDHPDMELEDRLQMGLQIQLNRLINSTAAGQMAMLAMLGCMVPELALRTSDEKEKPQ